MVVVWRAVYVETTTAPALSTDADTVVFAVFDDEPLQADEGCRRERASHSRRCSIPGRPRGASSTWRSPTSTAGG